MPAKQKKKKLRYDSARTDNFLIREEMDLMSFKEASEWASNYLRKKVTPSNGIFFLGQGRTRIYSNALSKQA
jgi:hypothetical protein